MKDNWNLKNCKEIHLKEFDADIYHWDKKIGETVEIEVSPRIMIPERSIRTKGSPRYFTAFRKSDIETLQQKLIEDERADYWGHDWLETYGKYPPDDEDLKKKIEQINKRFGVKLEEKHDVGN